MAMLTYVCSQSMLVILWILNWTFWLRDSSGQVRSSYPKPDPWPGASIAWYALFCIGLSGAFFTGIFGTGKQNFPGSRCSAGTDTDQPLTQSFC